MEFVGYNDSSKTSPLVKVGILAVAALIIVVLVIFISKKYKTKQENLDNVSDKPSEVAKTHEIELANENIMPSNPAFFDAGSGTILAGPEFVPNQYVTPFYQASVGNSDSSYLLDDGKGGQAGLQYNQCSKACCSPQTPVPFGVPVEKSVCDSKSEFVPNPYTCNNSWQDSGCVCMTKDQANFIGSRGGNA